MFPGMWRIWSPVHVVRMELDMRLRQTVQRLLGGWDTNGTPYNPAILLLVIHPKDRIQIFRRGSALPGSRQ